MSQKPLTYADAGVSIDAGNALVKAIGPLARSTARPGADAELGGFGGLFDLKAAGYGDPLLVAANDGVGTKLKLAIETGRHAGVGIDLVAMCANDLIVQGAEPLFFLDYYACAKLDNAVASAVVESIAEGCRQAGCALIGGETAEMPGMYAAGDYDLAGFCVGAVERDKVLTGAGIEAGDIILGLASSGVHSNGFSLVRQIIERQGWDLAEILPAQGGKRLAKPCSSRPEFMFARSFRSSSSARSRASPTSPAAACLKISRACCPTAATPISSRTGGNCLQSSSSFSAAGSITAEEMARTFNCGIGMAVIVSEDESSTSLVARERGRDGFRDWSGRGGPARLYRERSRRIGAQPGIGPRRTMRDPKRVGILISGRGSNMRSLVEKGDAAMRSCWSLRTSRMPPGSTGRALNGIPTWAWDSKGVDKEEFDRC